MSRAKGFYSVLVVGLLLLTGAGVASAQFAPRRVPGAQLRTAPRPAPKKLAPKKQAPMKAAEPATPPAPSPNAVMMVYQRIGRDIIQLQNLRGTECTLELWKTFREIKLEEATATADARIETAATLLEIQQKIERKKGITIRQECLDNPLAAECG